MEDEPAQKKDDKNNQKNSKLDAIKPPQRKVMTGVDYRNTSLHYNRGVTLEIQRQRVSPHSNYLPAHMQNHAARISLGTGYTYNTLNNNNNRD